MSPARDTTPISKPAVTSSMETHVGLSFSRDHVDALSRRCDECPELEALSGTLENYSVHRSKRNGFREGD